MHAEETLARWRADEAAVRSRRGEIGVARPDQVAGLSGMEMFQAMFDGRLPSPPIGHTLDFLPVHIEPGFAVFQGKPGLAHYNPLGTVHGGVIATLLDSAAGCAVHSLLPAGAGYTTVDLHTTFLRPVTAATGRITAEGTVLSRGSRTALAEARLCDGQGRLLAHATSTCLILDLTHPTGDGAGPAAR